MNEPQTKQEAQKRRYGQWAGNLRGNAYNPARCAFECYKEWIFHQCTRAPGSGPDGLYCKQHAKRIAKWKEA